jgi:4-cresol dehydrogenase (hydroxylating)
MQRNAIPNAPTADVSGDLVAAAIAAWTESLGPDAVITEEEQLTRAGTATFAIRRKVPAILLPSNRAQVQECLRVANRFRVPLYPIGSGKNWGYGSGVPSMSGCALLDLRRMKRIVDFSEDLAYVTVEPGVTQQQLMDFLAARRSKLWIDATGASPECSLIGNTVERGFGHTPYSDHFGHCCGLEAVLPTGDVVRTGFSRVPGAKAAPVYKYGVGPYVDGLFTQSNLGIVTEMTIWLMPAPEYSQAFFFRCDEHEGLAPLIDALRPLRLNGTLQSAVHIGNSYKVLSGLQQYPWQETNGETPLSREVMQGMAKELNFGVWNGSGCLYGTKAQVAESRRLLKGALKSRASRLQFLDDSMLAIASRFAKPVAWITGWDISRIIELVKPVYGLMKGIPTADPLRSTYWRKRTPAPSQMDPDRDRCGLLWCSHTAPIAGSDASRMTAITEELVLRHGFEPAISITLLTERTLCSVASIAYDRDVPGEDQRAQNCYRELMDTLLAEGYAPYRLGIQSAYSLPSTEGYDALVRGIKQQFDPNQVLAPGRYIR